MASVRVGLFPMLAQLTGGLGHTAPLEPTLALCADASVDHLCVGDHVSFFVGTGSDGLVTATTLLAVQAELPVYGALYLLPLRHGRLTLGVGLGGEDRGQVRRGGV
jgi:hypothetical protein